MKMRNKKKGFTLIELIVVMAIIAILAAIGVPQLMKTITKSKVTSDVATAKSIAGALQQYIAEGNEITVNGIQPITIDATNNQVLAENGTNDIHLEKYIDNAASTLKPKTKSTYNFYYSYDATTNRIIIYSGTAANDNKEIYPTLNPDYK